MGRQLISLALVSATGDEFYVEITDTWSEDDCSDFVKAIVLPQLDFEKFGLPVSQARVALQAFLAAPGPAEIIGDALAWDWPLFLELLGKEGLPLNIAGCREIQGVRKHIERGREIQAVPHHALLDARILRDRYEPQA